MYHIYFLQWGKILSLFYVSVKWVTNPNIGLPISYLINNIIKGNYSNMNLNREGTFHDLYVVQASSFSDGNTETQNGSLKFHYICEETIKHLMTANCI